MKNIVKTIILATLATCITSYTACEQNPVAAPNNTIVNQQETLQTESSSTGSSHNETPTLNTGSTLSTYLIGGGITVVAIISIIMAIRHYMHRDLETPFVAIEDREAHIALSQALSEII